MTPALDIPENITWPGGVWNKPKGLNIVTHLKVLPKPNKEIPLYLYV